MTAATPPVHDLLLALAGRLDDDLLAWARELLAVGEEDQAVELVTAALAAEQVVLPPTLRAALVAAARTAHADLDVEGALVAGAVEEGTRHRFDAAAAPDGAVVSVLTALPARRLTGCTLHLTWRRTPAGTAPGPLPRAVVLVEADPERSPDVLAYLLATELDRAGVPASVEVFTTGRPLPAYHTAAMRSARAVVRGTTERPEAPAGERPTAPGRHQTAEVTSLFPGSGAEQGPAGPTGHVPPPDPVSPRPADLFAPPPTPPDAGPPRSAGRRRRPEPADGAPSNGAPSNGAPSNGAPSNGAPSDGIALPPPAPGPRPWPPAVDRPAPLPDTVEPAPDTDPFSGPLRAPLLAPLLDPTGVDPDTLDPAVPGPVGDRVAPAPAQSAPAEHGPGGADTEQAAPAEPGPVPTPPDIPRPPAVPAEWEEEWRTGEWAMPRTPRPAPASDRPGPDDVFGLSGASEPVSPELPRRVERIGRPGPDRPDTDQPGALPFSRPGEGPSAVPDGGSLFESPTAAVTPSPAPRPTPQVNGGGHVAPPSDAGRYPSTGGPLFPHLPNDGPDPVERPGPAPAGRPAEDDPLFGPGASDLPLFGAAPGRAPERTAPEEPRPGRRRRPDDPPPVPFPASDTPLSGHVPAPSRPRDDPEPPALLHGTEGDLLAQLQAELAAREQRPRPYRRAGRNGSAHPVNGHGPDGERPPPDLAG